MNDTTITARQAALLADAGEYLAGGGLGLFQLPPDLNLVVERGQGSRVWSVAGKEYIDYHLSSGPALLGHAHPAVLEAVSGPARQGYGVLLPQRARSRARGAAGRGDPVRGRGSLHRLGHRGDVLRPAHRARVHQARQAAQVRGRVARHARLRPVGHRAGVAVRLPARQARLGRHPARRPAIRCW